MSERADKVRNYFQKFADTYAPESGSPLYERLSYGVLQDPEMLALAARCSISQPPANVLYGAVHYLLLRGLDHPLRAYYPDVLEDPARALAPSDQTYALFRDLVGQHREQILPLLKTRLVQTNVVRRTTVLLPAFGVVAALAQEPLALLEVGASAGLNLHWDRFRHVYEPESGPSGTWGPAGAALELRTQLRGELNAPLPGDGMRVAWRAGVDLNPIDVGDPEARLWLRALIFPEHVERHAELDAAAAVACAHPVPVHSGDVLERAPELLAQIPADTNVCLYATMVLYQLSPESREALWNLLRDFSRARPLCFLSMEGTADGGARIDLTRFRDGRDETRELADAHPHGRWLRWHEPEANDR